MSNVRDAMITDVNDWPFLFHIMDPACYFVLNGSWQLKVTIKAYSVLLYTVGSHRSRLD